MSGNPDKLKAIAPNTYLIKKRISLPHREHVL